MKKIKRLNKMEVFRNKMIDTIEHILINADQIPKKCIGISEREDLEVLTSRTLNHKKVDKKKIFDIFSINSKSINIGIDMFLDHISKFKDISDQQLKIASFIFVKILLTYGNIFSEANNYQFKLFAGSLLIAHKFIDDIAFDLESFETITSIDFKDLQEIEMFTLELYLDSGGSSHLSKLHACWMEVKNLSVHLLKPNSNKKDSMAAPIPTF